MVACVLDPGSAPVANMDISEPSRCREIDSEIGDMRRRLLRAGGDSLDDDELLRMILYTAGTCGELVATSDMLLKRFQGFGGAISASGGELASIEGVDSSGAAMLKLVHAAALRLLREELPAGPVLACSNRLEAYLRASMAFDRVEQAWVLYLDARCHLLSMEPQGPGSIRHASLYPREVIRRALELNATALIVAHNHPSGNPTPSRDDICITNDLIKAGATMDIVVYDHVIVAREGCLSLRREKLIQ